MFAALLPQELISYHFQFFTGRIARDIHRRNADHVPTALKVELCPVPLDTGNVCVSMHLSLLADSRL